MFSIRKMTISVLAAGAIAIASSSMASANYVGSTAVTESSGSRYSFPSTKDLMSGWKPTPAGPTFEPNWNPAPECCASPPLDPSENPAMDLPERMDIFDMPQPVPD